MALNYQQVVIELLEENQQQQALIKRFQQLVTAMFFECPEPVTYDLTREPLVEIRFEGEEASVSPR